MIQIKLFSHLEICLPDTLSQRLQVRKTGLLLAYLACFPTRSHSRSFLAALFWPDAEEKMARANLRTTLNELKNRMISMGLSAKVWQTTPDYISLNTDYINSDVGEFRAAIRKAIARPPLERKSLLEQAVSLYRGHLLEECAAEWLEQERIVLAAMCQQALTQLVVLYREENAFEAALLFAEQATQLDPHDVDAHLQLMQLLFDTCQFERVVLQYAKLARQLKKNDLFPPSKARTLRRHAIVASRKQATLASQAARLSSSLRPSNIHSRLTAFLGRQVELERLRSMLAAPISRLVTLTGPGGSGKTRLALETALLLKAEFGGRVYWADMAEIDTPRQILAHVARSLFPESSTPSDPLARLQRSLGDAALLIILDNFEHLVDKGHHQVTELLAHLPALKILVTSRQRLRVHGEQVFPVLPLATPGNNHTMDALQAVDSVLLFVDRAQAAHPHFSLNTDNASEVAALCNALDGIPLALEIAAAWIDTLSPSMLLREMRHRFELLVNPYQDADARHASLWGVIEWSYRRLSPELQYLFAALSVFRGGWTLEAMVAVCPAQGTASHLKQLQERSLVMMREVEGEPRFFFLETLREFAQRHLPEAERQPLSYRHAAYFLQFALAAQPLLRTAALSHWLERLAQEHDNLMSALETWGMAERYDHYLRLASALRRYWLSRGCTPVGLAVLKLGLAEYRVSDAIRADGLLTASVCLDQSDLCLSQQWLTESLQITQSLHDKGRLADTLMQLARLHDPHDLGYIVQAETLFREVGDRTGEAYCLHMKGGVYFTEQAFVQAETIFLECVRLRLQIEDYRGLIFTYQYLGNIYVNEEDYDRARQAYQQSLTLATSQKNHFAEGGALVLIGLIDFYSGDLITARRLIERGLKYLEDAYALIYEVSARTHLARIALKQGDLRYARQNTQSAARLLLSLSPLSKQCIRLGTNLLRVAVLTVQRDYRKACLLWWSMEAALRKHRFSLGDREREEMEMGRTRIEAHLSEDTIAALRLEADALPFTSALEMVLTL